MLLFFAKKEITLVEKKTFRDDDSYYHHVLFKFNSIDQRKTDYVVSELNKIVMNLKQEVANGEKEV